jgi:hypothetical protein
MGRTGVLRAIKKAEYLSALRLLMRFSLESEGGTGANNQRVNFAVADILAEGINVAVNDCELVAYAGQNRD